MADLPRGYCVTCSLRISSMAPMDRPDSDASARQSGESSVWKGAIITTYCSVSGRSEGGEGDEQKAGQGH